MACQNEFMVEERGRGQQEPLRIAEAPDRRQDNQAVRQRFEVEPRAARANH